MKSVLISINPKWCAKIASGEKTVEVRKTRPKLETPFKCYIYCTNSKKDFLQSRNNALFYCENRDFIGGHGCGLYKRLNGKVIGEFVCDEIGTYEIEGFDKNNTLYQSIRRHIYDEEFEHTLSFTEFSNDMEQDEIPKKGLLKQSCLTFEEIAEYIIGDKEFNFYTFYGWHISNLVIYQEQSEIGELYKACDKPPFTDCTWCIEKRDCACQPLKRPPQSWCYVERREA